MSWQLLIPGVALGFISSFHCIGMCGPLALSLPLNGKSNEAKAVGILLYNLGRIVSYSIIGLVFGFFGRPVYLAGLQQVLSIVLGIALLSFLILSFAGPFPSSRFTRGLYGIVQGLTAKFIHRSSLQATFVTGLANGFLPCGMVYVAVTGALVSGNIPGSIGFMAAFGVGTMPLMLLLSLAGVFISMPVRSAIRKLSPFVIASVAVLLILRGINLGIPYLSPAFHSPAQAVQCH